MLTYIFYTFTYIYGFTIFYFYIRITKKIINSPDCTVDSKKDILATLIYEYFEENKSMILEGFVRFRLKEYRKLLDYITELSVYNYLNLTV